MHGDDQRGGERGGRVYDAIALIGSGLVSGGAWMVYPPAGLIVAGCMLLALAFIGARVR